MLIATLLSCEDKKNHVYSVNVSFWFEKQIKCKGYSLVEEHLLSLCEPWVEDLALM